MFNKTYICLIMLSFSLLTGCATVSHVPLSKHEKVSIKSVYVNPKISKPEKMYEFASGAQFGVGFGLIGGLISGVINATEAESTQSFVERNHISISDIVYKKWLQNIPHKLMVKTSDQPSDTVLTTDIVVYGISIRHGFSTDYVPVLKLNAKLIRNKRIIWQDSDEVLPMFNNMPRYKMDQILRDPNKLYVMWEKAADRIINNMLSDMNK